MHGDYNTPSNTLLLYKCLATAALRLKYGVAGLNLHRLAVADQVLLVFGVRGVILAQLQVQQEDLALDDAFAALFLDQQTLHHHIRACEARAAVVEVKVGCYDLGVLLRDLQ